MYYALSNSKKKIRPGKGVVGFCPNCHEELIPKCGSIMAWHWAHKADRECDVWAENEGPWHDGWKRLWPAKCVETQIVIDGIKHIADIMTPCGVVIELQHSYITAETIAERELFYQNMLWVFDLTEHVQHKRFWYTLKDNNLKLCGFKWLYHKKIIREIYKPIYLDVGDDNLIKVESFNTCNDGPLSGRGILVKKHDFVVEHTIEPKPKQETLF